MPASLLWRMAAATVQTILQRDADGKRMVFTLISTIIVIMILILLLPILFISSFLGMFSNTSNVTASGGIVVGTGILSNPCPGYTRITSEFEGRINPITGKQEIHGGMDLAAPAGTPIYAAAAGKIITSGWHNSYGNYVMIDHGNGMVTLYGHMRNRAVIVGQTVIQGQCIGYVGSTGDSTGNHVHFEVRINGKRENPRNYM